MPSIYKLLKSKSIIKKGLVEIISFYENNLHFIHYNLYKFGNRLLQDYDANDYINNYEAVKDLVEQDIKQFKKSYFKDLAHGVESLGKALVY